MVCVRAYPIAMSLLACGHEAAGATTQPSPSRPQASSNGSSSHRESKLQSCFTRTHSFELIVDLHDVSRLPAQPVNDYTTDDAHLSWQASKDWCLFVSGRNLLQPSHQEFTGDHGNPVGIRRAGE